MNRFNQLTLLASFCLSFAISTATLAQDQSRIPLKYDKDNMMEYLNWSKSTEHQPFEDKISLLPSDGIKILEHLRKSLVVESTTSCRKEQKSVISDRTWRMIQMDLKRGHPREGISPIPLVARDLLPPGGKNSTLTLYGKGVAFQNDMVETNFILRIRFYMQVAEKNGEIIRASRSPLTADKGWLEIKVRNPSKKYILGVNKYRVQMKDEDILALIRATPGSRAFDKAINAAKENASTIPGNNESEVNAILDVVKFMGEKDPDFIRPQLVVTYERTAFKHVEPAYPLKPRPRKRPHGQMIDEKNESESESGSESAKSGENPVAQSVEYQITADENVTYLRPEINLRQNQFDLERYYHPKTSKVLAKYPSQAKALEFKDPFPVANYKSEDRSTTHEFIYTDMMEPIHSERYLLPGFTKNIGKAGHFRFLKNELREDNDELAPNDGHRRKRKRTNGDFGHPGDDIIVDEDVD